MRIIILIFFTALLITGCGSEIETITVKRDGYFTLNIDEYLVPWHSNRFTIYPGQSTVKYFGDESEISVLFRRHYFVFEGETPDRKDFELIIILDLGDSEDIRHTYSSEYDMTKGGLHDISLIVREKDGDRTIYKSAALSQEDLAGAFFRVERQNSEERLIAGSMAATLSFTTPAEGRITINSARFNDIQY